ncbi:MAG: xylulokinase, partial [Deltaproteobacteria bacterium]|nr:xylulokinase [Deltaproteobacteria bacterium]
MQNGFLGLDIGTTSIKALVVDHVGQVIFSSNRPLELLTPQPAWAEQDPDGWWEAVQNILHSIPKTIKVQRIGLSGQMHTLVPIERDGRPIRNAILWCDQRTSAECALATKNLGGERQVIELIGNPIYPGFTLPKLLWMRQNEQKNFKRIKTALIAKDYIAYKLTGSIGTDPSDAAGSAMYDVVNKVWSGQLLEKLGLDPSILPPVTPSHAARGLLRTELAKSLGWDRVEVASGGADNAVSALGLGVFAPGDCMISIGTSGTVLGPTNNNVPDQSGRLHFFNHTVEGVSYYMGVMLAASACLNWFKDKLNTSLTYDQIQEKAEKAPIGANGLLWLPYLQGERTPHRDSNARGVLFGVSTMTDEAQIFRAVMEGITFGLRDCFELLKYITKIDRVLVVGGGAKSRLWREMLATNIKLPVIMPAIDEGGAYGAAMLAAIGTGLDVATVGQWQKTASVTDP